VVGVRQARLEIAEDLAEESRREESRPEGAGCILADVRQQPESHSDLRGHVIKLPADLLAHSVCSVRRGETSGLRAYAAAPRAWAPMRDGCGLSGRPSGRCRCRGLHFTRWDAINEAAADSLCDVKLAARENPRPGGSDHEGGYPLEPPPQNLQHVLCAIRRPRLDGPPVGFAECLRGAHA